jgi:hypothetical protein
MPSAIMERPAAKGLTPGRLPLHYAATPKQPLQRRRGDPVSRPRAADDFATIRARLDELRRERDGGGSADPDAGSGKPLRSAGESDAERRRRARMEGLPPPWVPTIFVRKPRG